MNCLNQSVIDKVLSAKLCPPLQYRKPIDICMESMHRLNHNVAKISYYFCKGFRQVIRCWLDLGLTSKLIEQDLRNYWTQHEKLLDIAIDRLQYKKLKKVGDSIVRNGWISQIVKWPKFIDNWREVLGSFGERQLARPTAPRYHITPRLPKWQYQKYKFGYCAGFGWDS